MLLVLLTAAAYFYYNWQYFSMVRGVRLMPRMRVGLVVASFFLNYLFFYMCSVLEFPLVLNWFLFAFLLFLETLICDRGEKRPALFSTLMGIIYGLAVNISCRSMAAIVMNQPLASFNNQINEAGNLKGIPVLLGFALAGVLLQLMCRASIQHRFRLILDYPQHQFFLLEIMAGLFFYLFLNLMLYSTQRNDIFLKIWSIKSCLFSMIGFYIAMRYTWRICELDAYQEKNRRIAQQLEAQQQEEMQLRQRVILDAMTGFYNRQYAEKTIAALARQHADFTLCFLDLDGLKSVNDRFGHDAGDRYILTATRIIQNACRSGVDLLFRYGGDEFLVVFMGLSCAASQERAEDINRRLHAIQSEEAFVYPLSLSYGIVHSTAYSDWRDLIHAADQKMYAQKQQKQMARHCEE
nr:GGDEF domain-containing protein [Maliibacterium massiliense]